MPLGAQSVATIESVPAFAKSDLVFTTNGEVPSSGWSKSKVNLDALMLEELRQEAVEAGIGLAIWSGLLPLMAPAAPSQGHPSSRLHLRHPTP